MGLRPKFIKLARYLLNKHIPASDARLLARQTVDCSSPKLDPDLKFFAEPRLINMPVSRLRYFGGLRFDSASHPFAKYYAAGVAALGDYYEDHQPRNIYQSHFMGRKLSEDFNPSKALDSDQGPLGIPWLIRGGVSQVGEGGFPLAEGLQYFGPVSPNKLAYEAGRLKNIRDSIEKYGYKFRLDGPRGYFLVKKDGDWVFNIVGGQHRVAAIVALGSTSIKVLFDRNHPRFVCEDDVGNWPAVRRGGMTKSDALLVFNSYFR